MNDPGLPQRSVVVRLEITRPTVVFNEVFDLSNVRLAVLAGIDRELFHPRLVGVTHAGQLIEPLRAAIASMEVAPDRFVQQSDGWLDLGDFKASLYRYLDACEEYPNAEVEVFQ